MKSFRIKNIKSFEDSGEINIKPLTVFVGKNSCGKSTLIRFPVVISQTLMSDSERPIAFYGKSVDYGTYEDIIHHGSNGQISFELKYDLDVSAVFDQVITEQLFKSLMGERIVLRDLEADIREVTLVVALNKIQRRITVMSLSVLVDEKCIYEIIRINKGLYRFVVHCTYKNGTFITQEQSMDLYVSKFNQFVPTYELHDAIKSIYKSINPEVEVDEETISLILHRLFSDKANDESDLPEREKTVIDKLIAYSYTANLLGRVYDVCVKEARFLRYIGPFRAKPERHYRDFESISSGVGVHGENTSTVLISDSRKKEPKLLNSISQWTKEVLGYEVALKDISNDLYQIMLRDSGGVETNIIDNGYGVSQVLPIITEVTRLKTYRVPKRIIGEVVDSTVVLEQPELHIHPAAQSELADLFTDSIIDGNGKKKILVETHSEHLIRKIQVLIADKKCPLTNDMVAIYYVDKDQNGHSFVEEMKILDNGKFAEPWPSGFFDKGYQLSRALAKAGRED